jgi:hypothetical protein
VFAAVATLPPPPLIGTARKYSSAVSMYVQRIHKSPTYHSISPSSAVHPFTSLFHSHASPPREATLEIISEDSSRSPSHANAKPCSSSPLGSLPFTYPRMDGITRDESDGFAARGCLRYQTQDIRIPSASIYGRTAHLRATVIALRYMHVLGGQMVNGKDPSSLLA